MDGQAQLPIGEPEPLPVIPWSGKTIPLPAGHVPNFVDLGDGRTIDDHRLPVILGALLALHPEAERLRKVAADRPGLSVEPSEGSMCMVRLAGEPVGLFDARLLDA